MPIGISNSITISYILTSNIDIIYLYYLVSLQLNLCYLLKYEKRTIRYIVQNTNKKNE